MDELQKLYDVLVREGKYTKSFDEFQNKWKDNAYQSKVFDVVSRDGLYTKDKDSFFQKYSGQNEDDLKKKVITSASKKPKVEVPMASASAGGSLVSQKTEDISKLGLTKPAPAPVIPTPIPTEEQKQTLAAEQVAAKVKPAPVVEVPKVTEVKTEAPSYYETNIKPALGIIAEPTKSILEVADNAMTVSRQSLQNIFTPEENFLLESSNMPATDFIKNIIKQNLEATQRIGKFNPLDISYAFDEARKIFNSKIINSDLPQQEKNKITEDVNSSGTKLKSAINYLTEYQKGVLPDNVTTTVVKNIAGMLPDIAVASLFPAAAEARLAGRATTALEVASPIVKKYLPKIAQFGKRAFEAPFTSIMTGKGILAGAAEDKENMLEGGTVGGAKGFLEGIYMHGLGEAAGAVTPLLAKPLAKMGIESPLSTTIMTPLANAGVFAGAKAIRTPIEEGRMATGEELAVEMGTGIGFSLMHLGSQYKNLKELNHYYENVLKNGTTLKDASDAFGRVLNETSQNIDLAYNPELNLEEAVADVEKLKKQILTEPDLAKKKKLGNEAILIQNQIDAKKVIDTMLSYPEETSAAIENDEGFTEEQKNFLQKKTKAIIAKYDMSEQAVKTRELNQTILDAQAELDKASKELSTAVLPSDKIVAQQKADAATDVLEKANSDLVEVVNAPKVEVKPTEEVKVEVKPEEVKIEVKPEEVKVEEPKVELSEEAKKLSDLLGEKLPEPKEEAPTPKAPKKRTTKGKAPKEEVVVEAPKLEMPKTEEPVTEAPKAEAPKKEVSKEEISDKEKSDLIKKDNELRDKALEIEDKLRAEGLKTVDLMKNPELMDIEKQREDIKNKLEAPKVEEAPVEKVEEEITNEDKIEEEYSKEFYRISGEKKAVRESDLKKEEKDAKLNELSNQLSDAVKKRNDSLEVEKKKIKVEKSFEIEEVTEEQQKTLNKIDELQAKIKEAKGKEKIKLQNELTDFIQSSSNELQARFRMAEEGPETPTKAAEVARIKKQMDEMSDIEANFEEPSNVSKTKEGNPVNESKSTDKKSALERLKNFLGKDNKTPLVQRIEDFNNIPMMHGMSDILASGNIIDAMNRTMKVGGGQMFNVLGDDIDLAWAGVNKEGAQRQYDDAVKLYNGNKELFQRLWAEGKLPDGHIPMAIMRMGNTAINSNEAVFRYIEPYINSLPEANRKAALDEFVKGLKKKAEGNSASIWYTDLAEKINNGEHQTVEDVQKYLNEIINNESNTEAKRKAAKTFLDKTKLKNKDKTQKNIEDIKEDVDTKIEKIIPFMLIEDINSKGITTLDGFLKEVIEQSKLRAEGANNLYSLPIRSYIYDKIFSKETSGKNNLEPIKALLKGVENARPELFTSSHIYEALGEPSMLAAKQGEVVSIVGIKVAEKGKDGNYTEAGGVKKTKGHNNYGFGPEGRVISLIENPKHGIDVFPEFKAKAVRIFKESKDGKYPSIEAVANQTGGAFFIDSAFKGSRAMYENISDLDVLVGKMRFAFPDVLVTTTKAEFDKALNEPGVRTRETEGKILYGMTKDGKIYLNPDYNSLNTPIHEFGHIWIDYLGSKASGKKGDMLLAKGLELVNGTKEYKAALKKYKEHNISLEEALVELIANKGVTIIDAAKKSKFKSWMNATFKYIKDNFTRSKNLANDKIKDLTLDEFINMGLADLLSGEKVKGKFSAVEMEGARARFALEDKMSNIINIAKENKFSDNAIKEVLKDRGYTEEQIAEAFPKKEREFTKPLDILSNAAKSGLEVRKDKIAEGIDKIVEKGNITLKNAEGLKSRLEKLNVSNEAQVKKFLDYAEKMFTKKPTIEYIREAYKATVNDIKNRRVAISDAIKDMVKDGSITVKQSSNLIARLEKLNVQSDVMVNRFLDYAKKVFDKADYVDKLNEGNKTKKEIAKLAKDKKKNVELTTLAKKFNEIKPSMVHDIEQYNEMASVIKDALVGTRAIGEKVNLNKTVNIDDAARYIDYTINNQNKELYNERLAEVQEMMGVDASEFTYEELNNFFENEKATDKYKETIVKDTIKKMFDTYSGVINEMFKTGYDAFFTGEKYPFTEKQKEIGNRFMDMDLSLLNTRQQLDAINSIQNFLENHSTAKMEATLSEYTGELKARELEKQNIKARDLKLYWSDNTGQLFADQFTSLPLIFEKMFGGVSAGGKVQDAMGITELSNRKSGAAKKSENIVDEYVEKFEDSKPNGKAFNEGSNITERGLAAFMMRSVIGNKKEKSVEFDRRKNLIEQSIEKLEKGDKQEKEKAELYKEAYDKLLKDSKNIEEVKSKTDKENLNAVDWWVEKWAENYEDMADVSLNVYNTILEKDSNYTPDRMPQMKEKVDDKVDLSPNQSQFNQNNGTVYSKESGSLMKAEKNDKLPEDRYIDLSFDSVNSNAMYDALIDVSTAASIKRVEAFMNSKAYDKIIPNAGDRKLLTERTKLYVRNIRKKSIYNNDTFSQAMNRLNRIANLGIGQALGGPSQMFKQVIPVALNTIVNAGRLDLGVLVNQGQLGFIDRADRAISGRGQEAQTGIESVNKVLDQAAKSPVGKAVKLIEKANNMYLKVFLKNPDVFIAKASWITYYEKSLKQQGIDTKNLDYKTDKVNEEAADFAQRMVDRQQNISDNDMAGRIFTTKDGYGKFIRSTVMPFASFRMNQTMRMMTDISNLQHWKTMSVEDRKIAAKSLAGFGVEMAAFKATSIAFSMLWGSLANMIMGNNETKEEKDKRLKGLIKGQATSALTDVFSPSPFTDKIIAGGTNYLLNKVQEAEGIAEDDRWNVYGGNLNDVTQSFGTFGIAAGKAIKLGQAIELAVKGKYIDDYGNERKLTVKGKKGAKFASGLYAAGFFGLIPPAEAASVANNMIKVAKRKTKKAMTGGGSSDLDLEDEVLIETEPKTMEEIEADKEYEQMIKEMKNED